MNQPVIGLPQVGIRHGIHRVVYLMIVSLMMAPALAMVVRIMLIIFGTTMITVVPKGVCNA